MTPREHFDVWAPVASVWSPWAKPALFAGNLSIPASTLGEEAIDLEPMVKACLMPGERGAIVVDLPGALAVRVGLELAQHGYRPVPMFNTTHEHGAVVDARDVFIALCDGSAALAAHRLDPGAPPAFLLDSLRLQGQGRSGPGAYDNRWIVFPQDFPSATFLLSQGIRTVTLLQGSTATGMKDIDDVLARWKQGGLLLRAAKAAPGARADTYSPSRWWPIRLFGLFALMALGLRRNSAGGFGARIPAVSSGGGFG